MVRPPLSPLSLSLSLLLLLGSSMLPSAQDGDVNPFSRKPFSQSYRKILEGRKKLPVYERMGEFYELVRFFSVSKREEVLKGETM